jgi:hypothetical protein
MGHDPRGLNVADTMNRDGAAHWRFLMPAQRADIPALDARRTGCRKSAQQHRCGAPT